MKKTKHLSPREAGQIKAAFSGPNAARNQLLFILGCNSGFRISELLTLRKKDVVDKRGRVVDAITIQAIYMKGKEGKKKARTVKVNSASRKAISYYLKNNTIENWLFPSSRTPEKAIDRVQAWRELTAAKEAAGFNFSIGAHGMRKTYAMSIYNFFLDLLRRGENVDPLRATSKALGHKEITSTEHYLDFDNDKLEDAIENINI